MIPIGGGRFVRPTCDVCGVDVAHEPGWPYCHEHSMTDTERHTYIVHPGTGTVLRLVECVRVTIPDDVLDTLTGDDYFDDVTVCEWAEQYGVAL